MSFLTMTETEFGLELELGTIVLVVQLWAVLVHVPGTIVGSPGTCTSEVDRQYGFTRDPGSTITVRARNVHMCGA